MGYPRNSDYTDYTAVGQVGSKETINGQVITGYETDGNGNLLACLSAVAITNGGAGYAPGCQATVTNGTTATAYVNKGSATSCLFTLIV